MKHSILVIGAGSIGKRHARCLEATGRVKLGICEPREMARCEAAQMCPSAELFASLNDALQRAWDGAVIATPAPTHIPLALQLMALGQHLLIEKPLSLSLAGIEELTHKMEKQQRVVAVAYVYRAHPAITQMRSLLTEKRLGRPVQLTLICGQHLPHFRPDYRQIYYADRAQGGGCIHDVLCHFLDLAQFLLGPIERIALDASHQVLAEVEVEDTVHAMTRQGQVMGVFCVNQHQAPNETILTVLCEDGTLRFDLSRNELKWMREPCGSWEGPALPALQRDDWFIIQEHAFLDALEGHREPLCSLRDAYQTQCALAAAMASFANGSRFVEISKGSGALENGGEAHAAPDTESG